MISFRQFLDEKFYGYKSRGGNSPIRLMSRAVTPARPIVLKPDVKKATYNSKTDAQLEHDQFDR